MRGGPRFSSPQASSTFPTIPEDPQMGGPSHAVPENDPPPVTFAPPPPPMGYENPIPTYPGSSRYNPYEYQAPAQDPYLEATQFNALYPSLFPTAYPTGYPVQGYQ
ncbi:hypothetical protein Hanom_Chr17g01588231 [Helianthus anomalus]